MPNLDHQMLTKMSNTVKLLAADMVQEANSGHPGMPMGLSDFMTIFHMFYKHNPKDPNWINRDRLVFSGGHGSALLYTMLYLWGYNLTIDDLRQFRSLNSKTPGHPENFLTEGVDVCTGPLGQGIANAVGMAVSSKYIKSLLNDESTKIINHKVYCLCGDGDLQEGISYEACSFAGHHSLDNLVIIYDCNQITIEGDVKLAFSESIKKRFDSCNFDVIEINGHNFDELYEALEYVQNVQTKPVLIILNTVIAKGAFSLEGTAKSHGAALGEVELSNTKTKLGFNPNESFVVPNDVLVRFRACSEKNAVHFDEWRMNLKLNPKEAEKLSQLLAEQNKLLKQNNKISFPDFSDIEFIATRNSNHKIINAIAANVQTFIGGSADLAPSVKTLIKDEANFPKGCNMHFGIREHAMAAIANGISADGFCLPFVATFLCFSDYLKPAFRLSALARLKVFYIFTHDSICLGEDGPSHQPIEHLSSLRMIPNSYTFRPADANENIACWKIALSIQDAPSAFVLSRQNLPVLKPKKNTFGDIHQGAYIFSKNDNARVSLIASGSELVLALKVQSLLLDINISSNVISAPCFELFDKSGKIYQDSILLKDTLKVAIEAATAYEWYKFADHLVNITSFGKSARDDDLLKDFGFDAKMITDNIIKLL